MKITAIISIILTCYSTLSFAQIDKGTMRDLIAACMINGKFSVQGKEPPITQQNGTVDIERTVKSWVNLFDKPSDKLEAGKQVRECIKDIIAADRTQPTTSRLVPRDDHYAILALSVDPNEYAKGVICSNPDYIRMLQFSNQYRQQLPIEPLLQNSIKQVFGNTQESSILKIINNLKSDEIDCSTERICEVRSSVPIQVLTDTINIFGAPMQQVKIMKGPCKDKSGFVNEQFIEY